VHVYTHPAPTKKYYDARDESHAEKVGRVLQVAYGNRHLDIIALLLNAGANPYVRHKDYRPDLTIIQHAIQQRDLEMLDTFRGTGSNVDDEDPTNDELSFMLSRYTHPAPLSLSLSIIFSSAGRCFLQNNARSLSLSACLSRQRNAFTNCGRARAGLYSR